MKKKLYIFFFLFSLPILVVVSVNELAANHPRTSNYKKEYCTWDCHNNLCKHWEDSYKNKPTRIKAIHKKVFDTYVNVQSESKSIGYRSLNLIVFLLAYPIIASLLLWNLIRALC